MIVAISGLNNRENPAPGIGVAKGLLTGEEPIKGEGIEREKIEREGIKRIGPNSTNHILIGLSYDPNEPGIYQHIFKKVYLMPYPSLGFKEFKARLEYIKRETGIEGIIPTLDAEMGLYLKYREELEKMGIKTLLPTLKQFEMRDKSQLPKFAEKLGVSHPETFKLFSVDELIKKVKELTFPVIVKGNYYKAYRANNLDEAIDHFYKISNEWGFPILLQEVVGGEEINFVGVAHRGQLLGGVGIKKLTTTDLGKIWTGVTIDNRSLLQLAHRFVEETNWNGPFELEVISAGATLYLIEINPRFPAWVHFATLVGINLPKMVVELMEGKSVIPQLDYPVGQLYVRYVEELVTPLHNFNRLISKKEL